MHTSNLINFPYTSVPSSFSAPSILYHRPATPTLHTFSLSLPLRSGLDDVRNFLYVVSGENNDLFVFWEVVVEDSVQQTFPVKLQWRGMIVSETLKGHAVYPVEIKQVILDDKLTKTPRSKSWLPVYYGPWHVFVRMTDLPYADFFCMLNTAYLYAEYKIL